MKNKSLITFCIIITTIALLLFLTACTEKKTEKTLTPDRDVAESMAGAVSVSTGGALDQISDLCEFLDVSDVYHDTTNVERVLLKNFPPKSVTINKTYDEDNGIWTINIEKIRGDSLSIPFAHLYRKYTLQFKNAQGIPQRHYITESDTATTVNFSIKQGHGRHVTRRISQQLDSLMADWTVTDANKSLVTINGTYYRAAVDTITGFNRTRTSDHSLELTFHDIVAPRGIHPNLYSAVSGSLTGTFNAVVTFTSGTAYNETTIHRDINIVFGTGRGDITIGSKHYKADLYSGELLD